MQFKTDCRFWRGDKPCPQNRLCGGCQAYQKLGPRILIIKMGARGDVLRTTPLLAGLRKKYGEDAHITWITAPESVELLQNLPGLDLLLALDIPSLLAVQGRCFDLVVCLDKEPWALALAEIVRASLKMGWGIAADGVGTPSVLNPEAAYSLALGVSDDLKFKKNDKTYMQIIFEAVGLTYHQEPYQFILTDQDRAKAREFFAHRGCPPATPVLGLFTGCGQAFKRKRWTEEGFAGLIRRAQEVLGARVLLLGGPEERDINERIRTLAGVKVMDTHGEHSVREFAAFIEACRMIVTGDTLALHLAIALQRPVVAIFGPTCAQEVDLFGRGEKVVSPVPCAPCYQATCMEKPTCMEAISLDLVWDALQRVWGA